MGKQLSPEADQRLLKLMARIIPVMEAREANKRLNEQQEKGA